MKLATTTADYQRRLDNPAGIIDFFKDTGFRHLDLNFYNGIYAQSPLLDDSWQKWTDILQTAASENHIKFCQAHAPAGNLHGEGGDFDTFLLANLRSIEICGMLKIPNLVIHAQDIGGYPSCQNRLMNLRRNKDFFAKLYSAMEENGVNLLLENSCDRHAPTPGENSRNFPSTAAELLELIEYVNHPLIHACWDTGHANIQMVDQYQSILELGEHLRGVHIQDNYGDVDSHIAPLQGTTNMDSIMQGLLDINYQGWFTFEACSILRDGNTWPHYRRSWKYQGADVTRLMNIPTVLKQPMVQLLFVIGKHILTEYGCFEE